MSEEQNLKVVQGIYEAFGRGDLPAMLEVVSDDVRWRIPGSSEVPYHGERHGHEGVRDFFMALGSSIDIERFEVADLTAKGDKVFALGGERSRVKQTGKYFDIEWAMVYTLNNGKVTEFVCYENTAAVAEAFRGD